MSDRGDQTNGNGLAFSTFVAQLPPRPESGLASWTQRRRRKNQSVPRRAEWLRCHHTLRRHQGAASPLATL